MQGQCIRSIDRHLISDDTSLWLLRGDMKGETESEVIAAQDQALQIKIMSQKHYKQKQVANAECKRIDETAEHVISACPVFVKEQYCNRYGFWFNK